MEIQEGRIELLFPTVIQYSIIGGESLDTIQKEMQVVYDQIKWTHPESWGQTHDLSTDDFTQDDVSKYNMVKFKELLHQELVKYCYELNFAMRPYTLTSWFSKFKPNDFGHIHNHGNADISGCYYFKTNGDDGDIFFEHPVACATTSMCYNNNSRWKHKPVVGKMLFFPGWMPHGIQRNTTSETRVSFAFNVIFER